jgi:ATP-dependent Lon protease
LRNFDADVQKERLDNEASLNKIICRAINDLEMPYPEKIKFLQLPKHDIRLETLITYLSEKTENVKGVVNIEEKVRREMSVAQRKKFPTFEGSRSAGSEKNELTEKINSKKLPENVRIEIEK